jgi:aspartate/methionine/tyrosine aminotransferase
MRCLLDDGDLVAVPDPGFPTYRSVADYLGVKVVPIPLLEENGFKPNPEDIKNLPKEVKLVILNSPNNPTGSMIDKDDAIDIFNACNKSGRYLLSDEIYHLITYGKEHYSPCCIDKCLTHTIMINGFSKNFAMTGFRLGYMIGPDWLCEKVSLLLQTIVSCTSPFIQLAGCEAYDRIPTELKRNTSVLSDRRNVLVGGLNEIEGISCPYPDGAFYAFANIRKTGMSSRQFTDLMFKNYVSVVSGDDFGVYGEGYVRLAFTESSINARIGLHRIETALTGSSKMIEKTNRSDT